MKQISNGLKKIKNQLEKFIVLGLTVPFLAITIQNPAKGLFVETGDNSFKALLPYLINILLGFVGFLAILFIIIGGYQYIASGANEEMAETGKKTLTNAIIGLVIVIVSYTIVVVIYRAFK